jgi:photosystem II stability/assembly factor-like uncharacterized protein
MKRFYSLLTLLIIVANLSIAQNFWQEIYSGNIHNRFSLNVSSNGYVYAVSDTYLIRSTDNGISWQNIYSVPHNFSAFGASPTGIIYLNPDSLVKSTDEGNSWQNVFCCLTPWFIIANNEGDIFIETGLLIGGGSYRSTDEGYSWTQIGIQPYFLMDMVFNGNLTFASFSGGQLYKSTNKGDNWELVLTAPANLDILFVSKNGYLYGGRSSIQPDFLFRSTDDGLTWSALGQGVFTNPLADIVENQLGQLFVASQSLGVFRSTDNGNSWQAINSGLSSLSPSRLVVDSLGYLYVINNYGEKLYRSVESTIPVELISFDASLENDGVHLTWRTASETNNYGFDVERWGGSDSKWMNIGFVKGSGTTTEFRAYFFIDDNITYGKYSYRLKQIDLDGSFEYSEIVEVEVGSLIEFSLEQNYPNPFNPTTNIEYQIPEQSFVTLKIYDVLGNEIAALVSDEKPIGSYEVEFKATGLPSGIYFYRLITGNFIQTKKMVLLK